MSERERERVLHEIEKEKIVGQRDEAMEHLKSAERAFDDVHKKYERTKEVIADFKKNEDALKARANELAAKLQKSESRFELLKSHAESKLAE